jgi:hypothetical protein
MGFREGSNHEWTPMDTKMREMGERRGTNAESRESKIEIMIMTRKWRGGDR